MIKVEKWDSERDEQLTEQALCRKLEGQGYHVSRYLYPPGTYFPDHKHDVDKIDAVLSGRFRIRMQNQEVILEAGDSVVIPRGVVHSAEVLGDEVAISLDAMTEK